MGNLTCRSPIVYKQPDPTTQPLSPRSTTSNEQAVEEIKSTLKNLHIDSINSDKYAQALVNNGVNTMGLLGTVDEEDLKSYGITLPHHVKQILSLTKSGMSL